MGSIEGWLLVEPRLVLARRERETITDHQLLGEGNLLVKTTSQPDLSHQCQQLYHHSPNLNHTHSREKTQKTIKCCKEWIDTISCNCPDHSHGQHCFSNQRKKLIIYTEINSKEEQDSSCEFIFETRGQPYVSFICNTWFISCLQLQINNLFQECRSSGISSCCLNSEKQKSILRERVRPAVGCVQNLSRSNQK